MTADVLNSPAVGLLVELEQAGIRVVAVGGEVYAKPANRLTAEQRAVLKRERDSVLVLVRLLDDGVIERRDAFLRLIAASSAILPALVFRPDTVYTPHVCYSCGDAIPQRWGRCWRCGLAARWASRQPISSALLAAYDEAPVVA